MSHEYVSNRPVCHLFYGRLMEGSLLSSKPQANGRYHHSNAGGVDDDY
jgi:hypothetical protein